MEKVFSLDLTQYQLGLIATAIREQIYAANDGRVALDPLECEELVKLLAKLQSLSDDRKCA